MSGNAGTSSVQKHCKSKGCRIATSEDRQCTRINIIAKKLVTLPRRVTAELLHKIACEVFEASMLVFICGEMGSAGLQRNAVAPLVRSRTPSAVDRSWTDAPRMRTRFDVVSSSFFFFSLLGCTNRVCLFLL